MSDERSIPGDDPWEQAVGSVGTGSVIPDYDEYDPSLSELPEENFEAEEFADQVYDSKGRVEQGSQEGAIKAKVAAILSGTPSDFVDLGGRRVKIDLTFAKDKETILRFKSILEECIKSYTVLRGVVETSELSPSGVYIFKVTNEELSPDSDSSHYSTSGVVPKKIEFKKRPQVNPFIFEELRDGIRLEPKYRRVPACTLIYGKNGLTEHLINNLKKQSPNMSKSELIQAALKQVGEFRRLNNLYK